MFASYYSYGNRTFDNRRRQRNDSARLRGRRVQSGVDPNTNKLVGYSFDEAGNTKTDANGQTFIYDAENKQTEVKNSSGVSIGRYFYDGDGKRVKKVSAQETTVFVYNGGGTLTAEYSTARSPTQQVSYLTTDHLGSPENHH